MIDLRSDTVTKPSQGMRKAMYDAEVGDDVFQEDPTAIKLQEYCCELFGKEAALFVSSGVMGNQLSLRTVTEPGDEIICEKNAHIFNYESGSIAALSGVQLYPVDGVRGAMAPADVEAAIRPPSAYYMPKTKVIAVENTHNRASGAILPFENITSLHALAKQHNLVYHMDGARIWNASVASGVSLKTYGSYPDTMSVCFSKGLGAPVGSMILGSKEFIERAFRIRKSWGGGMRQIGILAAAALYALRNNIERLHEDHEHAQILTKFLSEHPNVDLDPKSIQTNIVIFTPKKKSVDTMLAECKAKGLLLSVGTATSLRAITHLDVTKENIQTACAILAEVLA